MTECNYFEVPCTRSIQGSAFSQGVQDYVFSIGAPNCWYPHKSYFRVDMSIYQPGTILPLLPSQMSAFADNAVGNLFDNTYVRAGQQDISRIVQFSAQASALDVRLNNTLPWLKSMGSSTAINESSFMQRLQEVSANAGHFADDTPQLTRFNRKSNREIYRPTGVGHYSDAVVNLGANNGVVTGTDTKFQHDMPRVDANGFPHATGGSIIPGDIIVINGLEYEIESTTDDTTMNIIEGPNVVADTSDWYIIRSDVIRDKQACSSQYAIWQPPIGLFKYNEELGAGDYRIQLNPNSNYLLNAVETRNTDFANGLPYNLVINDVKLYIYVEKKSIPDTIRDLYLSEIFVQAKPYNSNLQFTVPPSTYALTVFVQDNNAGKNPNIPPSMFRMLDYTDLSLNTIQITYANVSKPSINWVSTYAIAHSAGAEIFDSAGNNRLEQRYHDSYEESGLDLKACGNETFYDYLQRGPFYHYAFERDINNKATEVQITTTFSPALSSNTNMMIFIAAHFRKTVQITTSNGHVVNVSTREV